VAFADLHVHANRIARLHRRPFGQLRLFNDFHGAHCFAPSNRRASHGRLGPSTSRITSAGASPPARAGFPVLLRRATRRSKGPAAASACASATRACATGESRRGCPIAALRALSAAHPASVLRSPLAACTAENRATRD